MAIKNMPYWLTTPPLTGRREKPQGGGIAIIGSGLTGASVAYFLQKHGFDDLVIIDDQPEKAASFRNCGHVLHGAVESPKALHAIHGFEKAQAIWDFSVTACETIGSTVKDLDIEAEYRQDGYLVIAIDDVEAAEIEASSKLLVEMGYSTSLLSIDELNKLGFRHVHGARFDHGSAQIHPLKFRNGIMAEVLKKGASYHSGVSVVGLDQDGGKVSIRARMLPDDGGNYTSDRETVCNPDNPPESKSATSNAFSRDYDAVVIAANAYSPLFSKFYAEKRLLEPFKGQILTSHPLKTEIPVSYPHSFDHGYEYALKTQDNRLVIGGWRNNVPSREVGTYDLAINPDVSAGLAAFVRRHYSFDEEIQWDYAWTGIMATSRTGLPFIGPTSSPLVFTCGGYTGHGVSWAHGSAALLADIIAGNSLPESSYLFNPVI